jgi:hypothetical protein
MINVERQEFGLRDLTDRELETVDGGLDREHCGTCRTPWNPSLPPPLPSPWGGPSDPFGKFIAW